MADVGAPSELTKELTLKIRQGVLDHKEYKKIQEELDIPTGTWDYWVWDNYHGFRDSLNQWKHERMVKKAERKVDILIESEDERVALEASKFTLKTLDKENYSEKTEMEHKGEINVNHIDEEQAIRIIKRRIAGDTMPVKE